MVCQVGAVTYEIDLPDRAPKIYHVNLLKAWVLEAATAANGQE